MNEMYMDSYFVDEDGVVLDGYGVNEEIVTRLIAISGRGSDIDQMLNMASGCDMNYTQFTEPKLAEELVKVVQMLDRKAGVGRRERSGLPWTAEEDAQLAAEHDAGLSIANIAEAHQRSNYAISMRLKDQGIVKEK